jgi:HEAT repeat protein
VFAAILIGAAVVVRVLHAQRRGPALARFAATAVALVAVALGLTAFLRAQSTAHASPEPSEATARVEPAASAIDEHTHGEPEHGLGASRRDLMAALNDEHDNVRARAASELGALGDASDVALLVNLLKDPSDAVKESAAQALGKLARPEAGPALEAALARRDQDEWVNLREAEALVRCGGATGMDRLIDAARDAEAKLVREQALERALSFAGQPLPPAGDDAARAAARASLAQWWQAHRAGARWDAGQGRFVAPP